MHSFRLLRWDVLLVVMFIALHVHMIAEFQVLFKTFPFRKFIAQSMGDWQCHHKRQEIIQLNEMWKTTNREERKRCSRHTQWSWWTNRFKSSTNIDTSEIKLKTVTSYELRVSMKSKSIEHTKLNATHSLLLHSIYPHTFNGLRHCSFTFRNCIRKKGRKKPKKNIDSISLCQMDWEGLGCVSVIFSFASNHMLNSAKQCICRLTGIIHTKRESHWHWKLTFRSNHFVKLRFSTVIFFSPSLCLSFCLWNSYAHTIIMSNKRKFSWE